VDEGRGARVIVGDIVSEDVAAGKPEGGVRPQPPAATSKKSNNIAGNSSFIRIVAYRLRLRLSRLCILIIARHEGDHKRGYLQSFE
jgi:hypothetical protein